MSAPLRRSVRPSDRRLMLGYAPAVALGIGLVLMALLVPTVAPEQQVAAGTPAADSVAPGTTTAPSPGATLASPVGAGATPGRSGPAAGQAVGPASASGGGGSTSQCSGPQVPNDPYAPPCISFSGGNGGATTRGVTADTINVTFRISADEILGVNSLVNRIAGKSTSSQFTETRADVERTVTDLIDYFNKNFQFYGRKIVVHFFDGQGQLLNEFQDAGQAQANADALTVAQRGAFAETFAISQPYAEALSAQHILNFGTVFMSQQWFAQRAPYSYSFFPSCTDLGQAGAAVASKMIAGGRVAWAGQGVSNGQPRRIAVMYPDNPVYQQCFKPIVDALNRAGTPPTDVMTYTLSLTQLSQEMSAISQKLVNDKITTVVSAVDPIAPIFLTGDLDNAHYIPEIFNIGAAFTDFDFVTQLFDQAAAAHIAGTTNAGAIPAYGSSIAYFAAKSVDPDHAPAREVDAYYADLYLLALGIQMAGPNLTPQTFQQGLFRYPGGDGQYGPWSFSVNGTQSWTPQHQFRFEWWDPTVTSGYNGQKGTWVMNPAWRIPGDIQPGPPPVFPNGTR